MASQTSQQSFSMIVKTAAMGVITLVLYVALFNYEEQILNLTSQGKWSFMIPIAIAFTISFFHGAFTGGFWDVLGVKAKK